MLMGVSSPPIGGTGDANNPYIIMDAAQLDQVRTGLDKHYKLGANIDLSESGSWMPIGDAITPFTGSFDGNGYTIDGLNIDDTTPVSDNIGLFGVVGPNGKIKNAALLSLNVAVSNRPNVGSLAGTVEGTVSDSYVTGTVSSGTNIGGLIGTNTGTVSYSYAKVNVSGSTSGGLVATNGPTGKIQNSYVVDSSIVGLGQSGGLVGANEGEIRNSYTNVTFGFALMSQLGGLVGKNTGKVENTYSAGTHPPVTGSMFGGLIGMNYGGLITASYYDKDKIIFQDLYKGEPKSTAEMKQQSTFTGWNFTQDWQMQPGEYPTLRASSRLTETTASFDRNPGSQADITVSMILNGNTLTKIENNGTALTAGNDYAVSPSGDEVTIKKAYLASQSVGITTLTFTFSSGTAQTLIITVSETLPPMTGSGTEANPYVIMTASDLDQVRTGLDKFYKLGTNIDLSAFADWMPIGDETNPFTGGLDGNGKMITGLKIFNVSRSKNIGLFGVVGAGGNLKKMQVFGATVNVGQKDDVGILAGRNEGTVSEGFVTGMAAGNDNIGGLIGTNKGTVSYSFANVNVYGSGNSVGGLIGFNQNQMGSTDSNIKRSYAIGNVDGEKWAGGLVGTNEGVVSDSYAQGKVNGRNGIVGGLIGGNSGTVNRAYATGLVSGSMAGGLIGDNVVSFAGSYYDSEKTSQSDDVGKGTPKTTVEMKKKATFTGWNFTSVWNISEGNGYPTLRQKSTVPLDSTISPTTASFDKNVSSQADVNVVMELNDNTLSRIENNGTVLTPGTDYTVSADDRVSIKKEYLAAQNVGTTTLTFVFSAGASQTLTITVNDTTPTPDTTPPAISDKTLATSGLSDTAVTLTWNMATDNVSVPSNLQYAVYRSASNNVDTVSNMELYGTAVNSYTANLSTLQVQGLTPDTTYYFNVIVKDEAGNKSAYTMKQVQTSGEAMTGTGTAADPYVIKTASHLDRVRNDPYKHYKLGADIDLRSNNNWNPIADFFGTFDGAGHKITGLTIDREAGSNIGLFGSVRYGAEVRNVGLDNVNVKGNLMVGGIAGYNRGSVKNSYVIGNVTGKEMLVGGLIGSNDGTVRDSYAEGSVTATSPNAETGGLIGFNTGTAINTYSTAHVTGPHDKSGGLVGVNWQGTMVPQSSYYDLETTGQSDTGKGIGKPTADMKKQSTFEGWDFNTIWQIDEENDYPRLRANTSQLPNQAPTASNVSITGTVQVGKQLTGEYVFTDPDAGDTEGASVYKWFTSDAPNGQFTEIQNQTGKTYTPVAGDQGKYIKFSVIPVDSQGMAGMPQISEAVGPVLPNVQNSTISPATASFDKNPASQTDVRVDVTLNGNTLSNIKNNGSKLTAGTDFTVNANGDQVTIKKEYLAAQGVGTTTLTFLFSAGADQTLAITVIDTTPGNSTITPTTASFDKKTGNQADILVTMALNGNTLSSISNGTSQLVSGSDYTVADGVVTIKKAYLATQRVGTTRLTFTFSAGENQTLTITVRDTTPGIPVPIVTAVQNLAPLTGIANGTAKTATALGLPDTVAASLNNGSTTQVGVDWDVAGSSYNPESKEEQTFTIVGTLVLPDDILNPNNVTASIRVTVKAADNDGKIHDIIDVIQPAPIKGVANGTAKTAKALGLPKQADVVLDNGKTTSLKVEWDVAGSDYDPDNKDEQTFTITGTLELSKDITNTSDLTASVKVTVKAAGDAGEVRDIVAIIQPEPISGVKNGTRKSAAALGLPTEVEVTLDDDSTISVKVDWDVQAADYDPDDTDKQVFTVTGELVQLPDGVTNSKNKTATIRVTVNKASRGSEREKDRDRDSNNNGSGGGTSSRPGSSTGNESTRRVTLEAGNAGANSSMTVQLEITRTRSASGAKVDEVLLDQKKTKDILKKAAESNQHVVRIIIDDYPKDPADEVMVRVAKNALALLKDQEVSLEIKTGDVTITIPRETLAALPDSELYFRVVPLKATSDSQAVANRVLHADEVVQAAGGQDVQVVGVPKQIETNYSNHTTRVMFPIDAAALPTDPAALRAFLSSLAVYVEHTDGEKALKTGSIRYDEAGKPQGIEIELDKFSTFTVLSLKGKQEHVSHKPYMKGYPNGTFQPNHTMTRAEIASVLATLLQAEGTQAAAAEMSFADVAASHWAVQAIRQVSGAGLMNGDANGSFHPDAKVTRAEMATIIVKWKQLAASQKAGVFTDTNGHWAEASIATVAAQGYMKGYTDGAFRPNQGLTRAEAVTLLNRLVGRGPLAGMSQIYSDVAPNHWAFAEIAEATMSHAAIKLVDGAERAEEGTK